MMALNDSTFYPQHIQLTHKTAAQWTDDNTVLMAGELGLESDTLRIKIGNGSTAWNSLQYTDDAIRARITELERLSEQFLELADSMHVYFNSLAQKLTREEANI